MVFLIYFIALLATTNFFDAFSAIGDVENVKGMVTPRFYDYLKSEIEQAGDYRPVYQVQEINESEHSAFSPYILVGNPKIFQFADTYEFHRPPSGHLRPQDPFPIYKIRPDDQKPPEPFKYVTISRLGNVALAGGWPMVISPDNFGIKYYWNALKNLPTWLKNARAEDENFNDRDPLEVARKYSKEMIENVEYPGTEGSLGYIIDMTFKMSVEGYIVERKNGQSAHKTSLLRRFKSDEKKFMVTLRSNHVTPGWKFNSETVRWYIDDINLTSRRIPWMGEYLPELHKRKEKRSSVLNK
jgi:hypothetical protein